MSEGGMLSSMKCLFVALFLATSLLLSCQSFVVNNNHATEFLHTRMHRYFSSGRMTSILGALKQTKTVPSKGSSGDAVSIDLDGGEMRKNKFENTDDDEDDGDDDDSEDDEVEDDNDDDDDQEDDYLTTGLPLILEDVKVDVKDDWRRKVEKIVNGSVSTEALHILKLKWISNRLELTLSKNEDPEDPESPSAVELHSVHGSIYEKLELVDEELQFLSRFELLVASPGIGDTLRSDRDFETFKGFPVMISTSEIFKKKTLFEGTLVRRDEDSVTLSMKGRIVEIPRKIVAQVKLPKSQYEPTDVEMQKLH